MPSLIENLLSIGKFSGESYFSIFERRNCQIVSKRIPRKIVSAATHEKNSSFYKLNNAKGKQFYKINMHPCCRETR